METTVIMKSSNPSHDFRSNFLSPSLSISWHSTFTAEVLKVCALDSVFQMRQIHLEVLAWVQQEASMFIPVSPAHVKAFLRCTWDVWIINSYLAVLPLPRHRHQNLRSHSSIDQKSNRLGRESHKVGIKVLFSLGSGENACPASFR